MALSDAATIALARELYPGVTVAVASDTLMTAWLPWARALVGAPEWGAQYDTGVAMLLAFRGQASGSSPGGGVGAVKSVSTLGMSVSYGDVVPASATGMDAWLATQQAGLDWLFTRSTLPSFWAPYVSIC